MPLAIDKISIKTRLLLMIAMLFLSTTQIAHCASSSKRITVSFQEYGRLCALAAKAEILILPETFLPDKKPSCTKMTVQEIKIRYRLLGTLLANLDHEILEFSESDVQASLEDTRVELRKVLARQFRSNYSFGRGYSKETIDQIRDETAKIASLLANLLTCISVQQTIPPNGNYVSGR